MKKFLSFMVVIAAISPVAVSTTFADNAKTVQLTATLKTIMPRANPDSIAESTVPGLFEVVYGARVIYITGDGRYMVEGDIFDIKNRVNVTETKRQGGRLKAVKSIKQDSLIVFKSNKDKPKHVITVFTDIDCGYCRKLHREMADYNKLGIEMRYAAFPRSGVNTESYFKATNVWCAKDPQKAMSFAKNGAKLDQLKALEKIAGKDCGTSVKKHLAIARELGITGTPTLVMGDGKVVPGYVPAQRLIQMLDRDKKS